MTRGDLVLIDTNVLLTATDRSRPGFDRARRIFSRIINAGMHPSVCGQIVREYVVVATRPVAANGLGLDPSDAVENVRAIRSQATFVEETADVSAELLDLVESAGATGKRIHDLNLVALMQVHRVRALVTDNPSDFPEMQDREVLTLDQAWDETG